LNVLNASQHVFRRSPIKETFPVRACFAVRVSEMCAVETVAVGKCARSFTAWLDCSQRHRDLIVSHATHEWSLWRTYTRDTPTLFLPTDT